MGIMVCGGNGSGKTTLGKELAKELNYKFMDIEDYYFQNKDSDYKYDSPRQKNKVEELLAKDIKKYERFVMCSIKGDYGSLIVSKYTCIVLISVPKEIRLERVRKRSFDKFGNRILPRWRFI